MTIAAARSRKALRTQHAWSQSQHKETPAQPERNPTTHLQQGLRDGLQLLYLRGENRRVLREHHLFRAGHLNADSRLTPPW